MVSRHTCIAAILTVLMGILGITSACTSEDSAVLPMYTDMPSFTLTDQIGRTITNNDLTEKVVVANFIFTNCTQSCPLLTDRMGDLQQQLKAIDLLGSEVILLSFSLDHERDSPRMLRSYGEKHGADHNAWYFLTGSPETIRRVVTEGFKLAFSKVSRSVEHVHEDGTVHVHDYDMTHTNRIALIDRQGHVRAYYDGTSDWNLARVLGDIKYLLD